MFIFLDSRFRFQKMNASLCNWLHKQYTVHHKQACENAKYNCIYFNMG